MFAKQSGFLKIEIVEWNDPVDLNGPAEMTDRAQHVLQIPLVLVIGHVKDIGQALIGPLGGVLQALRCKQENPASLPGCFFKETGALLVAGQTQKR
jgi:hypothetical protein